MAFCPNCGTPNTDQAEKCVACGFELAIPKQKPKFKGTIMMTGLKAPTAPPGSGEPAPAPAEPPPAQVPAAAPQAAAPVARGGRNMGFEKTMLGPAAYKPPTGPTEPIKPLPSAGLPPPSIRPGSGFAATVEQPKPQHKPAQPGPAQLGPTMEAPAFSSSPPQPEPRAAASSQSVWNSTGSDYGQPGTPGFASQSGGNAFESTLPPPAVSKPNPGKLLAIGCGALLALSCVVVGLLYFAFGDKLKALVGGGGDSAAEAGAWQASIAQSLAQVSALCQVDCQRAGVFFHPSTQAALLGEAKALTPERVQKLVDPAAAEAKMLDDTDDEELATKLGLDPQQCARVTAHDAKVVSCSVPDPSGKPGVLRIVHLSGIAKL